jgi:hypothetical protein
MIAPVNFFIWYPKKASTIPAIRNTGNFLTKSPEKAVSPNEPINLAYSANIITLLFAF